MPSDCYEVTTLERESEFKKVSSDKKYVAMKY